GFKETNENEINIEDVDPDIFLTILQQIFRASAISCETDFDGVLELANRLLFPGILNDVENFLGTNELELKRSVKLRLADRYGLCSLKEHLIDSLRYKEDVDEVMESADFRFLNTETQKRIQNEKERAPPSKHAHAYHFVCGTRHAPR
ncbi:hypothetical protein PFISCL1PPCAC_17849, partial [Pristionchus fissidentatus]